MLKNRTQYLEGGHQKLMLLGTLLLRKYEIVCKETIPLKKKYIIQEQNTEHCSNKTVVAMYCSIGGRIDGMDGFLWWVEVQSTLP